MDLPFVSACLRLWGLRAALSCLSWTVCPPRRCTSPGSSVSVLHDVHMYMWHLKDRLVNAPQQKGQSMLLWINCVPHWFQSGLPLCMSMGYVHNCHCLCPSANLSVSAEATYTVISTTPGITILALPVFVTLDQITFCSRENVWQQKNKKLYEDKNTIIVLYTALKCDKWWQIVRGDRKLAAAVADKDKKPWGLMFVSNSLISVLSHLCSYIHPFWYLGPFVVWLLLNLIMQWQKYDICCSSKLRQEQKYKSVYFITFHYRMKCQTF